METPINQVKISQCFSIIKTNIEYDNINGYYNIDRKMEDIVAKLLELVYGYKLKNTNDIYPNYPAIDLADDERKIAVQVTADNSIEKINRTFETFINSKEKLTSKYNRIIFFMTKGKLQKYDERKIRSNGIKFNKNTDILEYSDIMREIAEYTNEKLYPIVNFLENQYVSKLVRKISEVKKIECEDIAENYIERKVIQIGKNDSFNKENRKLLYEIISDNDKIVLLSDAGEGKTEEAKRLVNKINKEENNRFAFYKRLNTYVDKKIEELIPKQYEGLPFQNLLFVLDGLDEIEDVNKSNFIKRLEEFCEENKDIKVIVTCRKNFYENHNADYKGTLTGFKEYGLCKIMTDDINELLLKENINQEQFWKEINRRQLYQMVHNPFYLGKILKRYIETKILPPREKILDDIIKEKFVEDRNKYKHSINLEENKEQIEKLLEIIGLTLEYLGKNFLTNKEYKELIALTGNRQLLKYNSLWCKNDDENWSFVHNNFGEYLAARKLSKYPIEIIKDSICFDNIPNKINSTWINTLSFLINQYRNPEIIEWVVSVMPEFLSYIEKDIIDLQKRKDIFWTIYEQYKKRKIWIPYNIYKTNNLVSDENDIKYLLEEIKENYHYTSVGNALYILNNVDNLYGQEDKVKEVLIDICMNDKYTQYNKSIAIETLADLKLAQIDDLLKIIEYNKSKENSNLRKSYFYFCNTLNIVNEVIDIFIERFEIENKGMSITGYDDDVYFFDEHAEYEKAFSLISDENVLNKVIIFLENIEITNREDTNNIIKNLCDSIFNTYKNQKDLIKVLLKLYVKFEQSYNYENMNIILAKIKKERVLLSFFKECMNLEGNKTYREYRQIIDDECMEYYYNEYKNKKYRDDTTEKILLSCSNELKYYNELKNIYEERTKNIIQERKVINYDKIRKESTQYFFDKLFDKSKFLELISELKNEIPGKKLRIKKLREARLYDKLDLNSKYQYTLNFLICKFKGEDEITENTFQKCNWDNVILEEVYKIIHENKENIEISNEQKNIIQGICNKKIIDADFRNAIKYKQDHSCVINKLCIYLWFYRYKFDFKYPDNILLDMLEFDFIVNRKKLGIAYIEEQVNKIEVRNRIIENINKREIHGDVFRNHIEYCMNNNVGSCVESVGNHLLNKKIRDDERILATDYLIKFMKLEDFIGKYFFVLNLEFQKQILGKIIEKNSTILCSWIVEKLNNSRKIENKMFFAQQLMKIGNVEGIKYYYKWLKKAKKPYTDRNTYQDINSQLANIQTIESLDYLIKILELTFSKEFKDGSFNSIYSSVRKSIINIGVKNKTIFELVKEKLQRVFEEKQDYNNIGTINYIIDEMENMYCLNIKNKLSIAEIKKKIKENDEQIQSYEMQNWI